MIAPWRAARKHFFSLGNCGRFQFRAARIKIIKTPNSGRLDAKARGEISPRSLRAGSEGVPVNPSPPAPRAQSGRPIWLKPRTVRPQNSKGPQVRGPSFLSGSFFARQRSAIISALRITPGSFSTPFCTKTTTASAPFFRSSATGMEVLSGVPDQAPRFRQERTTLK